MNDTRVEGRKARGESTVKKAFGGALYQQGRGYYVALELLAIVRGVMDLEVALPGEAPRLLLPENRLRFLRRSHDFARRLLTSTDALDPEEKEHLKEGAEATLRALLEGLVVPVPRRKVTDLRSAHLYPYVGELVHYDALLRKTNPGSPKRISVERNTFRGGGGLAYVLLANDEDSSRLERTRAGFRRLLGHSDAPLARLADALASHDKVKPTAKDPFDDQVAAESECRASPWVGILRDGASRILVRPGVPEARRVDALMLFVPYCVAMHQLACARQILQKDELEPIVVDVQHLRTQVRELARRHHDEAAATVYQALESSARREGWNDLLVGNQGWRQGPRSFFTTTLATVGATNSLTGIRHFCLRPRLLETLVFALVDGEITFDSFVIDVLFRQLGLVLDGAAASKAGLSDRIDKAEFEGNSKQLSVTLKELGMLREYSDATQMVGVVA